MVKYEQRQGRLFRTWTPICPKCGTANSMTKVESSAIGRCNHCEHETRINNFNQSITQVEFITKPYIDRGSVDGDEDEYVG